MLAFVLLAAAVPTTPAGTWISPTGHITIQISPCATSAARWCGTVTHASDQAIADTRAASGRNLIGMVLVRNMRSAGRRHWRGQILVPDRKVTANGALRLSGSDTLLVKGCALGGVVCKSQRWRRAP